MKNTKYNRIAVIMVEEEIGNAPLAKYLGVTVETISKWRQNKAQPSLEKIYKIAEFFKIDVCKLLTAKSWDPGPSPAELVKIEIEEAKKRKVKQNTSKKRQKK